MTKEDFKNYEGGFIVYGSYKAKVVGYDSTVERLVGLIYDKETTGDHGWRANQLLDCEVIPEKYKKEGNRFKTIRKSELEDVIIRSRNKSQLKRQLVL